MTSYSLLERLGEHFDAVARRGGRGVVPVLHDNGVLEVLVQVVDILQHAVHKDQTAGRVNSTQHTTQHKAKPARHNCNTPVLERGRHADVVEHGQVLHMLAQADAAGVRTYRDCLGGGERERDWKVIL